MYHHTTEAWQARDIFSILTPSFILSIRTLQHINQCSQTIPSLTPPLVKKALWNIYQVQFATCCWWLTNCKSPEILDCQITLLSSSLVLTLLLVWVSVFEEQVFCTLVQDNFPELCAVAETVLSSSEIALCGLQGIYSLKGKKWGGLTHWGYYAALRLLVIFSTLPEEKIQVASHISTWRVVRLSNKHLRTRNLRDQWCSVTNFIPGCRQGA